MRGAKQGLSEGLKLAGRLLNLWPEHIGEQIAAHVSQELSVLNQLLAAALGVAHEIGLYSKQRREVVNESAAATEDVETGDDRLVGVDVNERKTDGYFDFGIFLRECSHAKQEHEPKQQNQFSFHCQISCKLFQIFSCHRRISPLHDEPSPVSRNCYHRAGHAIRQEVLKMRVPWRKIY